MTSLYCKGELTAKGMNIKACCKDVNKGGCCNTKAEIFKVKDNYVSSSSTIDFNKFIDLHIAGIPTSYLPEVIDISYSKSYWDKAPPLVKGDLYILFRSLII